MLLRLFVLRFIIFKHIYTKVQTEKNGLKKHVIA